MRIPKYPDTCGRGLKIVNRLKMIINLKHTNRNAVENNVLSILSQTEVSLQIGHTKMATVNFLASKMKLWKLDPVFFCLQISDVSEV